MKISFNIPFEVYDYGSEGRCWKYVIVNPDNRFTFFMRGWGEESTYAPPVSYNAARKNYDLVKDARIIAMAQKIVDSHVVTL